MIKNQEILLNQYRKSANEQIQLQKEIIKAEYNEKQIKMRKKFEKALKEMD